MEAARAFTLVDFIYMSILLVAFAIGWAQGAMQMLTNFLAFMAAVFVAGRYATAVAEWVNQAWGLQARIASMLERRITLPSETFRVPAKAVPHARAMEWLKDLPLPQEFKVNLAQRIADWSHAAGNQTVAEYVVNQLAAGVLYVLVFVVVTLAVAWILSVLGRLVSDQVKEIPLVGSINRLFGASVNLFETGLVIAVFVTLIAPTLSMYGFQSAGRAVHDAALTPHFITFFNWVRGPLFGASRGFFFLP